MKPLLPLLAFAFALPAQAPTPQPVLNTQQAVALFTRNTQLIESTMFATPELQRAGAALLENAREELASLRVNPGNALLTYNFLSNIRAYLALSDAVAQLHCSSYFFGDCIFESLVRMV